MKIIGRTAPKVEKLWGKQKIKDTEYRLMKYVLLEEKDGESALHNVVTGETLLLEESEREFIDSLEENPKKIPEEYSGFIEKHFFVPADFDEYKSVKQLRTLFSAFENSKEITGYTILPTTHCNARCFYCYESNFAHVHMTPERAHEVVEYIEKKSPGKKISIGWFGGEPLVGAKIISQICGELTDKGFDFSASMISNGALFTEELVKEAKEKWKLNFVQITIDGTENVYNETKAYVGMAGSPYQRVLKNIKMLSDAGIKVSIRINLGYHNVDDTKNLMNELSEKFGECKNVSMYVHELFDDEGFDPVHYEGDEKSKLLERVEEFNRFAGDKGMYSERKSVPHLKISGCMADNDGTVIINPDGVLTKCEHLSSADGFGSIYSEEKDKASVDSWKEHMEYEYCKDCKLYPSCVLLKNCPNGNDCLKNTRNRRFFEARLGILEVLARAHEKAETSDKADY